MNWTGGRLRRQSHHRPDSILKIQKQHFARARLKQREAHSKARIASAVPPSFDFCSGDAPDSPRRAIKNQQRTHFYHSSGPSFDFSDSQQDYQRNLKIRDGLSETNANYSERDRPYIHYIDILKQHLLGKKDWVGLSPTRPLKMKFPSINEKEQIGKRRKLSKDEEARHTAIARNNPKFAHIHPSGADAQLHRTTNGIVDWDMEIQISTPRKAGQVYGNPESSARPRSVSSDSMLSDVGEHHDISLTNVPSAEENQLMKLDTRYDPPEGQVSNNPCYSDQLRHYFDRPACSSKGKMSDAPPETRAEHKTSPVPVLHRFTLDDQVLAERIANSQRELESSAVHQSDHHDFYVNRDLPDHQDVSDEVETLLSFSVRSKTDDGHTNLSSSHESNPTDSDILPQTQKIARKLPPSRPHSPANTYSETPSRTLKNMHDISGTKDRPIYRHISTNNNNDKTSPTMLFGQEVHRISPEQTNTKKTFHFPRSTIQKNLFVPNIHGHRRPSPPTQSTNTPMTTGSRVNVSKAATVTETPRSASTFRFPSVWTPHRSIQRYSFTDYSDQNIASPASALVTPLPHPSPFIDNLSKGGGQTAGAIEDEERIIASVFNTPFRRRR